MGNSRSLWCLPLCIRVMIAVNATLSGQHPQHQRKMQSNPFLTPPLPSPPITWKIGHSYSTPSPTTSSKCSPSLYNIFINHLRPVQPPPPKHQLYHEGNPAIPESHNLHSPSSWSLLAYNSEILLIKDPTSLHITSLYIVIQPLIPFRAGLGVGALHSWAMENLTGTDAMKISNLSALPS